jgi:hypothetical protein
MIVELARRVSSCGWVAWCERRAPVSLGFRVGNPSAIGWYQPANFPASLVPVGVTPTTSRRIATPICPESSMGGCRPSTTVMNARCESWRICGCDKLIEFFLRRGRPRPCGTGQIGVTEGLSNGVTLTLSGAGVTSASFPPIGSLHVIKDDFTLSGLNGFATQSALVNAFSVPGPIVGAGLPGMVAACGALLALARRRRQLVV